MRGQADAAIETFEHLEHYLFDSGREVSAVRKRFRTHVEANWNSDFPRVVARLRRAEADGEAPSLAAVVRAAEDLIACHDLLDGLEDYARPGSLIAVCFGALAEGESAARRLSQLVGTLAEQLGEHGVNVMVSAPPLTPEMPPQMPAPRSSGAQSGPGSFEGILSDPNQWRTKWSDDRRVPSRIWREASHRAHQDWPQLFRTPLEQDPTGATELIPREILDLREHDAATTVVQVSIRGATLAMTRLHVALLEQLSADAIRQLEETSAVRLDLSAVAERLLVRSEPVRTALGVLFEAGLAEPFRAGRMPATGGACRITPGGKDALAAARRATPGDALPGAPVVEIDGDESGGEAAGPMDPSPNP